MHNNWRCGPAMLALLSWVSGLSLAGCANYALLQDAATMPKNDAELGAALTITGYGVELETSNTTTDENGQTATTTETRSEVFHVPAALIFLRAGVTERLELHGSAWFPFGASLGAKYMLVGEREGGFVFSPGLDVTAPVAGQIGDVDFFMMDFMVPLHMGYRFNDSLAGYVTPRYVARILSGELGHAAGGTIGLSIGKSMRLLLEGTAIYYAPTRDLSVSGAVGVAF